MKLHYPGCMSDEHCKCQDYDNEKEEEEQTEACPKCKGLGGYPRCPECLNGQQNAAPRLDYRGAIKVLEDVAECYEYRSRIYARQGGAVCGNMAESEKSCAEACLAAIRAITPYLK